MCKVYNSIGCLTEVKSHLALHNIIDFNSLNEVIDFQKKYNTNRAEIISKHKILIEQERGQLTIEIAALEESIKAYKNMVEKDLLNEIDNLNQKYLAVASKAPLNFIQRFICYLKKMNLAQKLRDKQMNFKSKVDDSIRKTFKSFPQKFNRYQFLISHFEEAVKESCLLPLKELDRKKFIIDEVKNSIYGALGEQKVVNVLEGLPDDYILINDFCLSFDKPIYNPQQNQYINSVQIDHILVSSSGLFLIETKNWSDNSVNSLSLRSPVEQICRSNFALFKLLVGAVNTNGIHFDKHHWGKRKIPIRNLIVLTGSKPKEEFQYVKILSVSQVPGYVRYFKPSFTNDETEKIASYLLSLNERR